MTTRPADNPERPTAAHRLSPRSRLTYVGIAVAAAIATVHFTGQPDAVAPSEITRPARVETERERDVVPAFSRAWVTPPGHTESAHSSAVCTLPSGDLLAVWYGGSREGGTDVALFTARLGSGSANWTEPVMLMDRLLAQDELDRAIKKVGNAVVFSDPKGTLWLVYVTVSVGGWSGSALNVKTSRDEGHTWSESQRLTLNPFFNLSSLVRNKPIYANDGRIGLPIYHEMAAKFPQMLWLTPGADGGVAEYRIRNLASEPGLIQPTLVPLDDDRVLMLLRDVGEERSVHSAYSEDNGWTWSDAGPTGLPNPDAAVDALRLRDGRILIVYNHAEHGRGNLRLALSADGGLTWEPGAILEHSEHEEFSYPNLAEDHRGRIHLTYTWRRERIRHVAFNLAWLDARLLARDSIRE